MFKMWEETEIICHVIAANVRNSGVTYGWWTTAVIMNNNQAGGRLCVLYNMGAKCIPNSKAQLIDHWFLSHMVIHYWCGLVLSWSRLHLTGIFSCDQAALWMVQSVRPSVRLSVRLSVCHTFLTMFLSTYHHEIFRSYYQWQKWRPCKKSRSEVKGQGHRGHDPT